MLGLIKIREVGSINSKLRTEILGSDLGVFNCRGCWCSVDGSRDEVGVLLDLVRPSKMARLYVKYGFN